MHFRELLVAIIFGVPTILVGSDTDANNNYESIDSQFPQFRNQIISEINKQRTAHSEDLRILKQQGNACVNDIQSLSEVIQDLTSQISQLKSKINHLEQENSQLKNKLDSSVNKLGMLIDEERDSRREADQEVVREVSVELSSAAQRTRRKSNVRDADTSIGQTYRLYEVVKGDTLGAIAKAFRVSLKRLKTLNNLENDTIYTGQKLKVP